MDKYRTRERLNDRFLIMLSRHFFEFFWYYLLGLSTLYILHNLQSMIPSWAKELADLVDKNRLHEVELWHFFLLALGIIFFRTASRLLFFYPARIQQKWLRMELMEKLSSAAPSCYQQYNDGQIFQRFYNDINWLRGMVGFGMLQIGNIILALIVFIPKIYDFNSDLFIAFSPMLAALLIFTLLMFYFQPYLKKQLDAQGDVQNFIMESYQGKRTVKNYHQEQRFEQKFRDLSEKELKLFFIAGVGRTIATPLMRLSFGVSLLWGAYIIYQQDLPGSSLVFFSGFLFLVFEPIMSLSWIGGLLASTLAGWRRIEEFMKSLQKDPEIKGSIVQESLEQDMYLLKFWNKNINFPIKKNQWNVFIGDTAVGKSYVLKVIADILCTQKSPNGRRISLVSQEPYIFNDTLYNNIILGQTPSIELENKVLAYCELFDLQDLAESFDLLLAMELGENGKKVSGGQAKRIALIRSLVSDAEVILWDDPFSSVDVILENRIINKLKNDQTLLNKTIILTSHRLATVKNCDQVIYLDKNQGIKEFGPVKELLSKGSRTHEFFQKQMV